MELGYEQYKALQILRDEPGIEGFALTRKADCSFDEFFNLAEKGLIDIGANRLKEKQLHPVISESGVDVLDDAKARNVI